MTAVPEIARNTWLKRCERPVARVTRIFQTNGTARDARKIIRMFHRCGDLCETLNSPLFPTACTETNSSMERSPLVWHLVTASFASPGFPSVRSSVTRLLLLIDSIAIELTVLLTVSCWFTSGCLHTKLEQKRFRRSAICFSTPFRIGQPFLATIRQKPSSTIHLHTRVPIEFLIDNGINSISFTFGFARVFSSSPLWTMVRNFFYFPYRHYLCCRLCFCCFLHCRFRFCSFVLAMRSSVHGRTYTSFA